jgi:hypothetical protein
MQGLPDNHAAKEPLEAPVTTCQYSLFSTSQCPKALAWMASLALAAGRREDAEGWLVEVIGALLFRVTDTAEATSRDRPAARSSTARMS